MSVTTIQFILMVIGLVAMIWGLYAIFRSWQAKHTPMLHLDFPSDTTPTAENASDSLRKDGIPVVPRHERKLSEEITKEHTEETPTPTERGESATAILGKIPQPQPVITQIAKTNETVTPTAQLNTQAGTTTTITADGDMYVSVTPKADAVSVSENPPTEIESEPSPKILKEAKKEVITESAGSKEPDAFSALANATQAITPVVHTYDESQLKAEVFSQNSPILDTHIQAQIDYEQNSPLHNAEQNINISIFPRHQLQRFVGKDFLGFVDKYGLKYGAMNMFHRYENKDGTGILWFSMMMVDDEGPSAFDLNKLPMQYLDGLILFLSLPHPEAGQAFESMISLAKMMANDLNAELYDDVGEPLSGDSINLLKSTAVSYDKPL